MQLCNDSVQTGSSIRPWELVTPLLMKETTDLGKLIPLISAGTHTDTVCIHVLGCCMFPCGNRQLLLSNVMNINTLFKSLTDFDHTEKRSFLILHRAFSVTLFQLSAFSLLPGFMFLFLSALKNTSICNYFLASFLLNAECHFKYL